MSESSQPSHHGITTYMHACPPARNVILPGTRISIPHTQAATNLMYSQVRVYPGNMCLLDRPRQGLQPPLGLPLERVLAPDGLVRVARGDVREDRRAFRDRNPRNHAPVEATDGLGEGEDGVLLRTMRQPTSVCVAVDRSKLGGGFAYSRREKLAGA